MPREAPQKARERRFGVSPYPTPANLQTAIQWPSERRGECPSDMRVRGAVCGSGRGSRSWISSCERRGRSWLAKSRALSKTS